MKRIILAAAALSLSVPVAAAKYVVELKGEQLRLLQGRAGLHAADSRQQGSLVRVISPGSAISKRGTVRVLVMNLGQPAFNFGPSDVRLLLSDGSVLPKVPLREFVRGHELVSREMRRSQAVDRQVKANLSSLAQSAAGGRTANDITNPSLGPGAANAAGGAALQQDRNLAESELPGAETLSAIQSVLQTDSIGPQQATGGYLVFELPKTLRSAGADERLTIVVRAGREEHRFDALLKRR